MNAAVATIVALGAITYGLKAAGPLLLGGRRSLPPWVERLALVLPAPLLAALVATSTIVSDARWVLDARLAGLAVAAVALWRRLPFVVVVALAAVTTAAVRALADL